MKDLILYYLEIDIKHLIAVGTMCPMINQMSVQSSVVLTEKNLKIARLLLSCAQNCGITTNFELNEFKFLGQQLGICWDHVLATIQHLYWVLGVRQISSGTFRIGGDGNHQQLVDQILSTTQPSQNSTILTISASNDIPDLSKQLDGLFESTTGLDDVSLHHVIASLCKLSSDQMEIAQITSKETSYFGLAKLLHTALSNLDRIHVFWKPVASHLLDVSHKICSINFYG
jgi:hypothetical protein